MRMRMATLSFIVTLLLGACQREAPSAIVDQVKRAGAGDVEAATVQSLDTWFRQRRELTLDVASKCKALDPTKQPATWQQSTEGRVCEAAIATSWDFAPPMKFGGEHKF